MGIYEIIETVSLSTWGSMLAGKIGYFVGWLLNWVIIGALLYRFVIKPLWFYPYYVEIATRRGNKFVYKYDRGRVHKNKNGSETFRLLKAKIDLEPLDFENVQNTNKLLCLGLVRLIQVAPKTYYYVKSELDLKKNESVLVPLDGDRNRAVEMSVKTHNKLFAGSFLRDNAAILMQLGSFILIGALLFLIADKFVGIASGMQGASEAIGNAVNMLNKCNVPAAVG